MEEARIKDQEKSKTIPVKDLRDILVIVGIFLFFAGWIYVYFFYDYFGISTSQVKIDYSSYIVYSFIVLTSYYWLPILFLMILYVVWQKWLKSYPMVMVFVGILLFPGLYFLAKKVANDKAMELRTDRNSMRQISFVFKADAGPLGYKFNNDSAWVNNPILKNDLDILNKPGYPNQLYLLGQNEQYYFVLHQPARKGVKAIPNGNIYLISKSTVLYSNITITSN